jgi:hypothetical protein
MVGANYTGGRGNAVKARSKDTAGRLQRGHFSKQRLGILTEALRSRRTDHQSLSRPCAGTDHPNLTANHRSGSLISPSGYSACTPAATIHDISLGHARRDLARKQLLLRQSTRQDSHLHRNDDALFSSLPQPDPPGVTCMESMTLIGKEEPGQPALLPETTPTVGQPCATSPPRTGPALRPTSLPDKQPTLVPETPSRKSKILDLIDSSDRERSSSDLLGLPHCLSSMYHLMNHSAPHYCCTSSST